MVRQTFVFRDKKALTLLLLLEIGKAGRLAVLMQFAYQHDVQTATIALLDVT